MNKIFDSIILPAREYESEYDCGDGAYMLVYEDSSLSEYEALCKNALDGGFSAVTHNVIEKNEYYTLRGKCLLNLCFTPCDNKLRVIADPNLTEYAVKPVYADKSPVALWQFEVDHSLIDCGMCYIVRCDDGSFFVIDSAHYYSVNDDIRLIEFLKKVSGESKPRVSGWFFSHGHEDHIGKFNDILAYYSDKLDIEAVYVNFPSENHRDAPWGVPAYNSMLDFRRLLDEHKEIRVVKLHAGMHFCVRNLKFDVLCTHEDVYPESTEDFNNTSTVIVMNACDTVVSFPGDASDHSDKVLIDRYNEKLKADIIQISHHGHHGTSPEFYRRTGAKCALFPVTVIKYDEEFPLQESNRLAVEIAGESYIASNGTVEIPLPYKPGQVKVYPDETFEDFDGIFNLWCYEYTEERKKQLYEDYLLRTGK